MPVAHGLDSVLSSGTHWTNSPTVNALFAEITNYGAWYYLLPMSLALVVAGLATRGLRRIAAFYGLAVFGALSWCCGRTSSARPH